ncbi:hypothetical protein BKG71_10895 [Mycobacteroides chelonae]|nr:hypothetical protein AOT86_23000 [Mycobacteroides sp. H072]KRQ42712.1 hypothetical protein AOT84_00705 [Mycobacteroides sp. H002]KRQ48295.1 hypothetical protein AOT85_19390 [Mycobacteroides sp. H054]KRQ73141.1 hypothetical protein AOT83_01755 [Mycobacteroides sp. H001]OHT47453.1 hypothetical protein BKG63_24605 [Mycobacteroides chelonae]
MGDSSGPVTLLLVNFRVGSMGLEGYGSEPIGPAAAGLAAARRRSRGHGEPVAAKFATEVRAVHRAGAGH